VKIGPSGSYPQARSAPKRPLARNHRESRQNLPGPDSRTRLAQTNPGVESAPRMACPCRFQPEIRQTAA